MTDKIGGGFLIPQPPRNAYIGRKLPLAKTFKETEISRLAQARRVFLFLDYDGTLAAIRDRPGRARLGKRVQELVGKISNLTGIRLAFVSGRPVQDLKKRIVLKGPLYVGSHGLEIQGDDCLWIHPRAKKLKPEMDAMTLELRRKLPRFPGVSLERKPFGLGLHYRLADQRRVPFLDQALRKICKPWIASKKAKLESGKKVWEIKPRIAWDKGRAVGALLKKFRGEGKTLSAFFGDDRTDEDAFRFLRRRGGITVYVGKKRQTDAEFMLSSPARVYQVLKQFYVRRMAA